MNPSETLIAYLTESMRKRVEKSRIELNNMEIPR